ncbi:MAG: glutamine-hydrolyzing carbamoyl-phosphate synthase small subunit [bacterium]
MHNSDLSRRTPLHLLLEDGSAFSGHAFGANVENSGEVVFNTGMVGYPESFTDPSYRGQILVLTYPLIGNYGVPAEFEHELSHGYESSRIHLAGLVVADYSEFHHHWTAHRGLSDLLKEQGIPAIAGIDTRALTKRLRERGTMMGRIACALPDPSFAISIPPVSRRVAAEASISEPRTYGDGKKRVALVDCGCKNSIVRSLVNRGVTVVRVPWNFDPTSIDCDGVLFSNGPGDPIDCEATIENARRVLSAGLPTFGICLGSQIIALAGGGTTYKLKFGHRGQNQPCSLEGSRRCYITSQNHGYAVDAKTLPADWAAWFTNANDGTNEGIRHTSKPFMGVQFHPEAMPGPVDTGFLFDEFVNMMK